MPHSSLTIISNRGWMCIGPEVSCPRAGPPKLFTLERRAMYAVSQVRHCSRSRRLSNHPLPVPAARVASHERSDCHLSTTSWHASATPYTFVFDYLNDAGSSADKPCAWHDNSTCCTNTGVPGHLLLPLMLSLPESQQPLLYAFSTDINMHFGAEAPPLEGFRQG